MRLPDPHRFDINHNTHRTLNSRPVVWATPIVELLGEDLPSTIGMAINPEGGLLARTTASIVHRAAQNGNGLGVERMVLEIPKHRWLSVVHAGAPLVSQPSAHVGRAAADDG
jgi:hypothetical protein